jgi:hypothetical protein
LNELIDWVRENARSVIIGVCALLVLSVAVGAAIGMVRRRSSEDIMPVMKEEEWLSSIGASGKDGPKLLLPEPYTPELGKTFLEYTTYIERHKEGIERIELIPFKLSDILKSRNPGEPVDIKPFQFNNEEMDIVTGKYELAEP